jgi:DNA-directed RNA polymerase specialized sigma24 family protein
MIDVAEYMALITEEARRIRHLLPRRHLIELADLVAGGAAHVIEWLRMSPDAGPALVRVYARQGMLAEIRRWDHGTKAYPVGASRFASYDTTAESFAGWPRRSVPAPPIELMIDLLRELLKVRLVDAYCWITCELHDDPYDKAAAELGFSRESIKNCMRRAAVTLRETLVDYDPPSPLQQSREEVAARLFRQGLSVNDVAARVYMDPRRLTAIQDAVVPGAQQRRAEFVSQRTTHRPDLEEIVRLRKSGLTHAGIARCLGCSQSSVSRILRRNGLWEPRIDSRSRRAA